MTRRKKKIQRTYTPPASAKVTPLSDAMVATMLQHGGPQQDVATAYTPGSPIRPTPGITLPDGPRDWTFPLGYNIGQLPRSTEATSFDTLRNLANLYDGIMLCEQVWFDYTNKLDIDIVPIPALLEQADGDMTPFQADIDRYRAFFEMPDPKNGLDLHSWLIKAERETLELDSLSIYPRLTRGGGLYSLEIIDGSSIKPLIDAYGGRPLPPFPAYQQFWHGVPLDWYTSDQLIYWRETERAESVYGLSRVERMIMRVNQALRKQNKDLAYYTEGNLPTGFLEMPQDESGTLEWTPDQILVYQKIWDGVLGGNDKMRSRLKVIPPGSKFTAVEQQDDLLTKFDTFLLNIATASFGLTMADLGFTENVNKSSGDSQENVTYRRAMASLMNRYARLLTFILRKYFNERRFLIRWKGFEETEDLKAQADAYSELIKNGLLTVKDAAHLMRLPYNEGQEIPRFVLTQTGPVFFRDLLDPEIQQAQRQAKLQGLQQVQQIGKGSDAQDTQDQNTSAKEPNTGKGAKDDENQAQKRSADFRAWRERATKDVQAGRAQRPFVSKYIPIEQYECICRGLATCRSAEDVKAVFEQVREGRMSRMGECQCAVCQSHDGKPVGDEEPPYHDGCSCEAVTPMPVGANA
jgi:hypothetical protein